MVTIKQAIEDLKKSELVEFDNEGNLIKEDDKTICTTNSELIILLERLQMLEEKTKPMKPIAPIQVYYGCPSCKGKLYEGQFYCERCGQAIDWISLWKK